MSLNLASNFCADGTSEGSSKTQACSPDECSLQEWCDVCFAELAELRPEVCSDQLVNNINVKNNIAANRSSPLRTLIPIVALQNLWDAFDMATAGPDLGLADPNHWLGEIVAPSVMRSTTGSPGWNIDLIAPFVRQTVMLPGTVFAVIGDLHGSIHSLLRTLLRLKIAGYIADDWVLTDGFSLVLLGDFVDRGAYGVEVHS